MPPEAAIEVVDNLDLVARFTAKPTGSSRIIAVRTTEPQRDFLIDLDPEKVTLTAGDSGPNPDLELPAEAFARLVYGRLDPTHTPPISGDPAIVDELRHVYPGL